MNTVTLQIPNNVDIQPEEITLLVATRLYEQGRLTLEQAAAIAGISKDRFLDKLNIHSISTLDMEEKVL